MTTFCIERGHEGPCHWLASETDGKVTLHDGCHSSVDGVREAAKLYHRIFGRDDDWFVVKVEPLPPWGDVQINEDAAQVCAQAVAKNRNADRSEGSWGRTSMIDTQREAVRVLADWCGVLAQIVSEERGNVLAVRDGLRAAETVRALFGVETGPVALAAREDVVDKYPEAFPFTALSRKEKS